MTCKWSDEWIATATPKQLRVAAIQCDANTVYLADTRNSSKSFLWAKRGETVRQEIERRTCSACHQFASHHPNCVALTICGLD